MAELLALADRQLPEWSRPLNDRKADLVTGDSWRITPAQQCSPQAAVRLEFSRRSAVLPSDSRIWYPAKASALLAMNVDAARLLS